MKYRRDFRIRYRLRSALAVGLFAAGLCVAASSTTWAERNNAAAPSQDAVDLIPEDTGLLPGETPIPGVFPNSPVVDDLGAERIHYVDAAGVRRTSVLVYMDPAISKRAAQRNNVRALAAKKGGAVWYEYGTVMPGVLNLRDIPVSAIPVLKKMPGVLKVEKDEYYPNVVRLTKSTPLIRAMQSQITAAGLSADGSGIRVCIADTGIDMDHSMYASRIDAAASWDFANNDSNPDDDNGHGSHVAGIAVGGGTLQIDLGCGVVPIQGVAPGATLIGAKILNAAGGGTGSDIIAGIDHCADQSASGGRADVINLSIGTGNFAGNCTHSWAVAANNAVANGVVVVAASGNECNTNSMGSPACGVDVIAVGATYKDAYPNCEDASTSFNWCGTPQTGIAVDDVVDFSNESDFLDVTAPGSVIWSASNAAGGLSLAGMSGTSMASPHVAGLAALILSADPSLTPAQVRQVIRDGAIDMGPPGFDRAYGFGRIDAIGSLSLLAPCVTNADCDDGLFCNGSETCSGGACVAGADPCPGQTCDEAGNACSAAPTLQFEWNMNSNPGWTTQGQWAWGQPTGGGGQHGGPDPVSGATGNNVFGYNLAGDYANNLAEQNLTTGAINCSTLSSVSVNFQRWLGVEQPSFDHAYFRISTNGTTWTTLWSNGAEVADTAWSLQTFDISAIADGQPTVFLRWTLGTTDGSWQYCGWNIDDVQIFASGGGGATCSDGIQNQGETRIDCGGPCAACACTSDAACADGTFCNGVETCDGFGNCQAGTAVNCSDGVVCTDDSCNEATNACDNVANNTNCDNGLFCDGVETCSATLGCQAGTAVNCGDGVACTDDSCNEATNSCDNVANNANCDNGLFCDGAETCSATLDCQAGTAVNCNDGVACTDDSCNEGTNACDNIANNANCDNGLFCDGAETCSATLNCQAGGDPCPGQFCDEAANACFACSTNGDCDDGLFCNGAETCVGGACQGGADPCPGQGCDEATNTCGGCSVNADCNDGIACTTDTCTAGVCSNTCANNVSSFPYSENFEAGLGAWSNVGGDVFDWTRDSGGTPSNGTGPSGDHTTGTGWYMYIETSSPRVSGDTAIFESPCFSLGGVSGADLSFWYHMNGTSIGTLNVDVSTDCSVWTNVWTLSGSQGNVWTQATVNLDAFAGSTITVRFVGVRGSSWSGDITIDDVALNVAAPCTSNAQCDDADACTTDVCSAGACISTPINCDDGLFCNGVETCSAGVCNPAPSGGVANGTFDGNASWTDNLAGGTISYAANLNVVGPNAGAQGFTWSSQAGVVVNGANLEFDLLSYSSSDTVDWDYPVFHLDGTFYGLNSNGTLGAATTGGTAGAGTISNGGQTTTTTHFVVDIDTLAGNAGPHTIGFGVNSADGSFGAGTAVYDNVIPAGGAGDPCPGQTCDEVNDVCIP